MVPFGSMEIKGQLRMVTCFVCQETFQIDQPDDIALELSSFEVHLVNEHKVIIPKFADWDGFCQFICSINSFRELQSNDRYSPFVMSRFDKEVTYHIIDKDKFDGENDSTIRSIIEKDFLENILKDAQNERNCTDFCRTCLFCKKVFDQNRSQLFDHLHHDHNFFLGHPDNIISSNKFLDILENKLKLLQCLYCEKNFKSWNVLKEHMRKKGHKQLNPNNREYDRFYLINYLCSDKHWKQIKRENDFDLDNDDWCDWVEEDKQDCLCFFCSHKGKFDNVKQHMRDSHEFDFSIILSCEDFYDRIKLVNYIRKRLFANQCFNCEIKCDEFESLLEHLSSTNHMASLPSKDLFNHPEYYFPTYEDDCFLFFLDDFHEDP